MSEFQSNAAFHLSQQLPLERSSHIVLPPYLIYGMAARTFWCTFYGSSVPFAIGIHSDNNIDILKEQIKQKMALNHIPSVNLVLWKASVYS